MYRENVPQWNSVRYIVLVWPINPKIDKRNKNSLWDTEMLSSYWPLYASLSWTTHRKVYMSSVVNMQ